MAPDVRSKQGEVSSRRVAAVLESALDTFARYGYRKTSMEDVANRADISRPGLYLHFPSKQALLQAAVEHALSRDVTAIEALLADESTPVRDRLLEAVDLWSGAYVGPLAADVTAMLERDAALLGDLPRRYATRFEAAVLAALQQRADVEAGRAIPLRDAVLDLAAGLKHRVTTREQFRQRLADGLDLLLR